VKEASKASPISFNACPRFSGDSFVQEDVVTHFDGFIASGCCLQSEVLLSISVDRNVNVPVGRAETK
jgi:hypothetical protein